MAEGILHGLPTPSAAMAVLLPVSVAMPTAFTVQWVGLYTLLIALLMVSSIPTFSGKKWAIELSGSVMLGVIGAAIVLVVAAVYPREFLVTFTVLYLSSIPISWISFRYDRRVHNGVPVIATEQTIDRIV